MPVAGTQLTYKHALALCSSVGFRKKNLVTAVALMCAESGRYVGAYHVNIDVETGEVDSTDRGLFQINDKWHPDLSDLEAYQAKCNAEYAFKMSSGQNFGAWAAYNSGAHLKFVPIVAAVRALGTWRTRIPYWDAKTCYLDQP